MTQQHSISLSDTHQGLRLDKALATCLPQLSRSRVQQLITQGQVTVNGNVLSDAKKKVAGDEVCVVTIPPLVDAIPEAQNIPLNVVYEDEMLLVINKPVGLTVHPGAGNPDGTMVNALLAHCPDSLSGVGGVARPGIVHRIDKDTSGLLIVAKNDEAHKALAAQLEDRSLSRRYRAFVWGLPNPAQGTIDAPIGRDPKNRQRMTVVYPTHMRGVDDDSGGPALPPQGKEAVTHYALVEAYGTLVSLVECKLQTGRTHQIRVHMKHIGHSLIGDATYGSRKKLQLKHSNEEMVTALREFSRQALHAYALEFIHPKTGEKMRFECEMPDDMRMLRDILINATRA